jgi:hypothetical protein
MGYVNAKRERGVRGTEVITIPCSVWERKNRTLPKPPKSTTYTEEKLKRDMGKGETEGRKRFIPSNTTHKFFFLPSVFGDRSQTILEIYRSQEFHLWNMRARVYRHRERKREWEREEREWEWIVKKRRGK